jgi:hypothetical protein
MRKMLALALVALLALVIVPLSYAGTLYDDGEIVIDDTALYPKTDGGSSLGKSGNKFLELHVGDISYTTTSSSYEVTAHPTTTDTLTTADSGKVMVYTSTDDKLVILPAATTLGQRYTIIDGSGQSSTNLSVDVDTTGTGTADTIMYLTLDAGDKITSATTGDAVTLVNVSANTWYVESMRGSWTDGS